MTDIITNRLVLSKLTVDDSPFIFELLNTEGWLKYIGDRGIKTGEDAKQYILNGPIQSYEKNGFGLLKMETRADRKPVGICGLIKREALEDIDIGFAILPQSEGRGYTTEAARAVIENAKSDLKLKRIVAITIRNNHRSIHVLEKLGMRFEKIVILPGDEEELMLFAMDVA